MEHKIISDLFEIIFLLSIYRNPIYDRFVKKTLKSCINHPVSPNTRSV